MFYKDVSIMEKSGAVMLHSGTGQD